MLTKRLESQATGCKCVDCRCIELLIVIANSIEAEICGTKHLSQFSQAFMVQKLTLSRRTISQNENEVRLIEHMYNACVNVGEFEPRRGLAVVPGCA